MFDSRFDQRNYEVLSFSLFNYWHLIFKEQKNKLRKTYVVFGADYTYFFKYGLLVDASSISIKHFLKTLLLIHFQYK